MKRNSKNHSLRQWAFKVSTAMKKHSATSTRGYLNATITHRGKRIRFGIEGSGQLPVASWNSVNSRVVGASKQADVVRTSLETLASLLQQANSNVMNSYERASICGPDQLSSFIESYDPLAALQGIRDAYKQQTQIVNKEESLTALVDRFIEEYPLTRESQGVRLKPGTLKNYKSMRNHVEQFENHWGKIKLVDLHRDTKSAHQFASRWHDWLESSRGLSPSTVGRLNKELNTVFHWVERYLPSNAQKYLTLKASAAARQKDSDAVLTNDEIDAIWNLELNGQSKLEAVRSVMVLAAEVGTRYSDLGSISTDPCVVAMNYQLIKQRKTGEDQIIVHSERVSSILTHFASGWPVFVSNLNYNSKFNKDIKAVCKLAGLDRMVHHKGRMQPLCDVMSSHCLRKSSITNKFLAGLGGEVIRRTSGHADIRSLSVYDKRSHSQIADTVINAQSNRLNVHR